MPQELREGTQETTIAKPEQRKTTLSELVFFLLKETKITHSVFSSS
jgi:hypothetical protein